MYKVMAVTNRAICTIDFLTRIEEIASSHVDGIILREKDLDEEMYYELAKDVVAICNRYQVPCILHTYWKVARQLGVMNIHLPLHVMEHEIEHTNVLSEFSTIGISIHTKEEAVLAQKLGATYITAGHIFQTDCKKGLPPRGLNFVKNICQTVSIPVYGIGGITWDNRELVVNQGAKGVCIMSGFMQGSVFKRRNI